MHIADNLKEFFFAILQAYHGELKAYFSQGWLTKASYSLVSTQLQLPVFGDQNKYKIIYSNIQFTSFGL